MARKSGALPPPPRAGKGLTAPGYGCGAGAAAEAGFCERNKRERDAMRCDQQGEVGAREREEEERSV